MIWSAEQVRAARGLFAKEPVSEDVLTCERAVDAVYSRLFTALSRATHSWAIELHRDDIRFDVSDIDFQRMLKTVAARWSPSTKTVEMRGGSVDGTVWTVNDVRLPIFVPVSSPLLQHLATMRLDEPARFEPPPIHEYRPSGWHETERHWVFDYHEEGK